MSNVALASRSGIGRLWSCPPRSCLLSEVNMQSPERRRNELEGRAVRESQEDTTHCVQ